MFAWQCFTYILCACWENESALDGCFVTLQQFVTLETSSLTSCIFPVGISFRNSLGLNIVVGYAIWVVCSYAYMAKCTVMRFVVMDLRMSNKPIFLEGVFCYFLLFEFTRWNFFSVDEARHRAQEHCFFETAEVVSDEGETTEIIDVLSDHGEATHIVDIVAGDGFLLLNISATFWECLAAHFKSFLLILYTYDAHTTTLLVTAKWFIWSNISNVWIVKRPLKKKEKKSCHNLGTTYQEWMTIPCEMRR